MNRISVVNIKICNHCDEIPNVFLLRNMRKKLCYKILGEALESIISTMLSFKLPICVCLSLLISERSHQYVFFLYSCFDYYSTCHHIQEIFIRHNTHIHIILRHRTDTSLLAAVIHCRLILQFKKRITK